ncbi:hypothetical protein ACFC5Z_04400 [Streptomyces sp. NPDC056004]|uniref:hypothetical protein n=1 Tax=Streptomyces sp. NPDC056004 TaxID=3345677 RepID=UPI0035D941E3
MPQPGGGGRHLPADLVLGGEGDLAFPAHGRIATVDAPVTLTVESIADYPFDAYDAAREFGSVRGGEAGFYAVFMMAAMSALALAVHLRVVPAQPAQYHPFAFAAFRNTAPDAPLLGSLLDHAAFLWTRTSGPPPAGA